MIRLANFLRGVLHAPWLSPDFCLEQKLNLEVLPQAKHLRNFERTQKSFNKTLGGGRISNLYRLQQLA